MDEISPPDVDTEVQPEPEPEAPQPRMPPIESRFLFVDVSAQRAKQLRRGALPRLEQFSIDPLTGQRPQVDLKLERVAMSEVGEGLIVYQLPEDQEADADEES